jgi:phage DNA methylase
VIGEKMEIEKIRISEITEYENNAKLHPREQIEQIKKSIQEFGNNDPIAIDENNVIIEGHGRYKALQELGFDEVEVIRLSHMSEERKRAYILVHNKLTMNSGFDVDILKIELDDIFNVDMTDFGFEIPKETNFDVDENTDFKEIQDESVLIVEANTEYELEKLYNEFQKRGIKCRVSIL